MEIKPFADTIHFENDGELEFFFVGTGSAFSKKYFQTNLLIIKGKDHLLVDCGTMCPYAFYMYNSNITKVRNLLITHSHADHIGGLEEAGLMGRYATKAKPSIIITDYYKNILWNQSLRGGMSYGEYTNGQYLSFDDYFTQIKPELISARPRPLYQSSCGSIDIKLYRTKHIPDNTGSWKQSFYSCGILVDERILFSGDTRFDPDLFDFILRRYPGIEWIFHDCQFFSGGVHASYEELKTLPEDVKRKMFLCHYGDGMDKFNASQDGFAGFTERGCYYGFGKTQKRK
ncbi:MBL fold metallo-hydrolase [Treponema sp. HNW]|uniref:MBL fold metallo-hydrolase n=1 Tax=Treponema sp. HNW TaxID=3116654 RepID=UPI003D1197FC